MKKSRDGKNHILAQVFRWVVTLLFLPGSAFSATGDEEVVLSFTHPAVGQYYIHAVYCGNTVYLPAMELFNLLYVHYETVSSGQSLQGTWPDDDHPWQINTTTFQASLGREKIALTTDDFRIGELDIFLTPALFEKMFALQFTIDMSTLNVNLTTVHTLPVEEKKKHEILRRQLEREKSTDRNFPLLYPRNHRLAGVGVVDYNLMMYADQLGKAGAYTLSGGMELLGGDLQGTLYGSTAATSDPFRTSNLSWRFAPADNPFFTSFRAGQISTTGLQSQRIVGAAISNDPIEPRKVSSTCSLDGSTTPDSEVELYINNQLVNYTRADELGYYRFDFPLTYGTVRINLRIYTPNGEILTEERQLQIPFTFLPKGVVSYNIQGGAPEEVFSSLSLERYVLHGDLAWGLSGALTAKAGVDYTGCMAGPLAYGGLSARLFDQYLLNIDAAPRAYYRANASVTYASSRSFSLIFTQFGSDSIYNPRRARQEMEAGIYFPFSLFQLPSGFRFSGDYYKTGQAGYTGYNLDFSTRAGRFNLRANYRDRLLTGREADASGYGRATGSVTCTFSRTPGVPVFVRGMFVRLQGQYDVHNHSMAAAGVQFSRTVLRTGRLNLELDHELYVGAARVQLGFTLDLNPARLTTQFTAGRDYYAIQQSLNGSFGLDAESARISATNREQVGRAALSVLMFVDSNGNSKYDHGEEKVPARALRLQQTATLELDRDSILRITQLQSYWQYNAEIVLSALPSPNLVPLCSEFSFTADPNRYKRIEIPLYRTGVAEGKVTLRQQGIAEGLGGLRLLLKGVTRRSEETVRTFSDGGFYAMNLLPGKYILTVDPAQLSFLNARSVPEQLEFEIKPLAEGDFLENLNLEVIPEELTQKTIDQ